MARLNIYVPDDLHDDLELYRDKMNLSEICAIAIRSELRSLKTGVPRTHLPGGAEWSRSTAEAEIAKRFDLRMVRVVPAPALDEGLEPVAKASAELLDSLVRDGMSIAVGGGAQMNAMVNHLRPRNARVHISAVGYGHVDRELPHVHPNMIATRMSLLYARAAVSLVGDPMLRERWPLMSSGGDDELMRVIIGGCSRWEPDSPYARLLGHDIVGLLDEKQVEGDYLGVFLDKEGKTVEPYVASAPVSNIGSGALYAYARRPDTLVVLVASMFLKLVTLKRALAARLCNALILDEETASVLIDHMRSGRI